MPSKETRITVERLDMRVASRGVSSGWRHWLALVLFAHGASTFATDAIVDWPFGNPTVTISAGENVTWSGGLVNHPLQVSDSTFTFSGTTLANSGTMFVKNFPTTGTYYFRCVVHGAAMITTVVVTAACPAGPYATMDIDGNGTVDALTDGMLTIRYMLGLRGAALVAGAVGDCATRSTSTDIQNYLSTRVAP